MVNETNDLDGPVYARQMLFTALAARGFMLMPMAEVDAKLKEQGFTDGGQLKATTSEKIGQWLGVDGLFYCTLKDFNYVMLGYYSQRTVKIEGTLVNAKTSDKLWEAERGWSTRVVVTDTKAAGQAFAIQAAAKFAEKLTHTPLQFETREAVTRLMSTIP
jgi:hypothetical protein